MGSPSQVAENVKYVGHAADSVRPAHRKARRFRQKIQRRGLTRSHHIELRLFGCPLACQKREVVSGIVQVSGGNDDCLSRLHIAPQYLRRTHDVQDGFAGGAGGNREAASRFHHFGNLQGITVGRGQIKPARHDHTHQHRAQQHERQSAFHWKRPTLNVLVTTR